MTWRRFCVLVAGLSPDSLFVLLGQTPEEKMITDAAEAEAHILKAWG